MKGIIYSSAILILISSLCMVHSEEVKQESTVERLDQVESLQFLQAPAKGVNVDSIDFKVYSMVWSAKYYNPSEIRTFFFSIPFSFDTSMKVDSANKNIHLEFPNFPNAMEMYRTLKEEGQKAKESTFSSIINFSDEFAKVDLSLDFAAHSDYALTLVNTYQNQTFRNVQIKITQPNSKIQRALYVTFDLAKGEVNGDQAQAFIDFLTSLKK